MSWKENWSQASVLVAGNKMRQPQPFTSHLCSHTMRAFWFFLVIVCVGLDHAVHGQSSDNTALTEQYLGEAKALNLEGKYEEANVKFRKILALNEVIPSELCYHFAETLFAIGQFQNSKNFVSKYFELTGQGGDNYDEVKKLEGMVDEQLTAIRECHRCSITGYRYFPCSTCDQTGEVEEECYYCHGHGIASCPKCNGDGVLISANALGGNDYHTCDRCEGNGQETCPICNGETTLTNICPTCSGFLYETSKDLCDHQDHPEDGFVVPYEFEKSQY